MFLAVITLTLCLAQWSAGQSCPKEYERLSPQHSFCTQANPNCQFKQRGINDLEKAMEIILATHNKLRNGLALGNAVDASSLPSASDMMQLFWDYQLAEVAQKHADQCVFEHDCNPCRAVANFPVGQNIWMGTDPCPEGKCPKAKDPDWEAAIGSFYKEVKDFNQGNINKFGSSPNTGTTGHFTQLAWAKSWRIGCGFVAFTEEDKLKNIIVCNYGPQGNINNHAIYIPGPTCSNCPINTCCGEGCGDYPGLCKMKDPTVAPVYRGNPDDIFDCDFKNLEGDCNIAFEGQGSAQVIYTLSGGTLTVNAKGGQKAVIHFQTPVKLAPSQFCLRITYKMYTDEIGGTDVSNLELDIEPKVGDPLPVTLGNVDKYTPTGITAPQEDEITFSLKFSVPEGAIEHILNVKQVEVLNGVCP